MFTTTFMGVIVFTIRSIVAFSSIETYDHDIYMVGVSFGIETLT